MPIEVLAQAVASLKGQLEDHIEDERNVMRDLADEVHASHSILVELARELPGLRAQVRQHDVDIARLKLLNGGRMPPPPPPPRMPLASVEDLGEFEEVTSGGTHVKLTSGHRVSTSDIATLIELAKAANAAKKWGTAKIIAYAGLAASVILHAIRTYLHF